MSPEDGFDCSGFVKYVLEKAGLFIPDYIGIDNGTYPIRHSREFLDYYGILVPADSVLPGDLVVTTDEDGSHPTHIGIMYDKEIIIHAPGVDDTRVSAEFLTAVMATVEDGVPYIENPIAFKSPTIPWPNPPGSNGHYQQRI